MSDELLVCRAWVEGSWDFFGSRLFTDKLKVRGTFDQIGNWQSEIGNDITSPLATETRNLSKSFEGEYETPADYSERVDAQLITGSTKRHLR